jgi:hypothetical protein
MDALYTDGDGRWHSQYIAKTRGLGKPKPTCIMHTTHNE